MLTIRRVYLYVILAASLGMLATGVTFLGQELVGLVFGTSVAAGLELRDEDLELIDSGRSYKNFKRLLEEMDGETSG